MKTFKVSSNRRILKIFYRNMKHKVVEIERRKNLCSGGGREGNSEKA
jgi:hypothetical protein